MNLWLIIPVKVFDAAKSRLGPAIPVSMRRDVASRLFRRTADVLRQAGMDQVVVVTRDKEVGEWSSAYGWAVVEEAGSSHSAAVRQGAEWVVLRHGADAIAAVSADLPLLAVSDVRALLRRAAPGRLVVAPDRLGTGTNAVVLAPPLAMEFAFGKDSFRKHMERARCAGLEVVVVRTAGLGVDLDEVGDLDCLGW